MRKKWCFCVFCICTQKGSCRGQLTFMHRYFFGKHMPAVFTAVVFFQYVCTNVCLLRQLPFCLSEAVCLLCRTGMKGCLVSAAVSR